MRKTCKAVKCSYFQWISLSSNDDGNNSLKNENRIEERFEHRMTQIFYWDHTESKCNGLVTDLIEII